MSFLSNLTCAECLSDYDAKRLRTAYTECQDRLLAQHHLENSDTTRAVVEKPVADSWMQSYERVLKGNTGSENTSELWLWN